MRELFDSELFVLLYWLRLEEVDAQGEESAFPLT